MLVQFFFLFVLFISQMKSQDNITYTVGVHLQPPLIYLSSPSSFNPNNTKNSDFTGILIDVFDFMASQLNISFNFSIIPSKTNLTTDFVLYYPSDYNLDKGFDPMNFYLKNVTVDYLKSNTIFKESYYIFFPSLLATLIQRVIWELFFIIFIVIIPWILLNAQIYYFFDSSKFRNLPFYKGFYKALSSIVFRETETKCGKIYSIYFLATTSVVCMLILADFIYTIANMLTRYDIANVYDLINNKANICLYKDENFQINFLRKISEIQLTIKQNIGECFLMIENMTAEAVLISEFFIKNYFKTYEHYNNIFRFYVKQNSFKVYTLLINNRVNRTLLSNVLNFNINPNNFFFKFNQMIDILDNSEISQNIFLKYISDVKYDRLVPSSILIESPILILSSLSITSIFIFAFLIIAIQRQIKKFKQNQKNPSLSSFKRFKDSKSGCNSKKNGQIQTNEANNNEMINLNFNNSITYQKIKADMQKKNKNEPESLLNSEIRKLNNNNNNEFQMISNKRQTLSFSGPIVIHEAPNEENGKSQKDINHFFIDKEVSSVERISSIKSASEMGTVFDNEIMEEEKK